MQSNTKSNVLTGLILKFAKILLPFIFRTVVLYVLGEKYLGLSSLFTSILQVLNISELGFSTAVIYHMYKPIANNDIKKVCSLLNYYKKIYRYIGLFILIVGLLLLPFLRYFINGDIPNNTNISILYILYLFDVVISYFLFSYKSALLNAVCRIDLVNIVQIFTTLLMYSLQIILLIIFKNYYLVVASSMITTIITNLLVQFLSNKKYPQYQCNGNISNEEKKSIKKQVFGLMIGKMSDTSRNSFDSIILSMISGLTIVAIYNNYYYILSAIYAVMLVFTISIQSLIGHNVVTKDIKSNYSNLLFLQFLFSLLISICCCELLLLYQPFIKIWVGKELILPKFSVLLFIIYFLALNINNAKNVYFTGNGLWWKAKKSFILESISNFVLNILLGYYFWVNGVIIATIVTIIVFNYIGRSNIIFKEYFKRSPKEYYISQLFQVIVIILSCILTFIVASMINVNNNILSILIYLILGFIIPILLFSISFHKSYYFNKTLNIFKKNIIKIKH